MSAASRRRPDRVKLPTDGDSVRRGESCFARSIMSSTHAPEHVWYHVSSWQHWLRRSRFRTAEDPFPLAVRPKGLGQGNDPEDQEEATRSTANRDGHGTERKLQKKGEGIMSRSRYLPVDA